MKPLLPVLFALLASALPAATPTQSDWNLTDHLPAGKIIIQGHRGVGHLAEENTVEAFELAWQMGLHPKVTNDTWAPPADESSAANPFRLRNAVLIEVGRELREIKCYYAARRKP